jgi:hypothetical protein
MYFFFFGDTRFAQVSGSLQIQTCVAIATDAEVHEAPLPL